MDNIKFSNEELVYIFNRLSREKEKMDEAIERKFVLQFMRNYEKEGVQLGAQAKPLTDSDVEKIKNSAIYIVCSNLVEKLQPIAEVILDADIDVQRKFEKYLK